MRYSSVFLGLSFLAAVFVPSRLNAQAVGSIVGQVTDPVTLDVEQKREVNFTLVLKDPRTTSQNRMPRRSPCRFLPEAVEASSPRSWK
jgi:hypothetical protein